MGPPRTRAPKAQASSSRFFEGSMNDRVSAAPPVHFLGPDEIAALERPLEAERKQHAAEPRSQHPQIHQQQQSQHGNGSRKGGNLLGQVWEGVRGRLRLRRDPPQVEEKKKPVERKPETDRPTREEALASYHQLVASGFFSSHAIQSTRQPPPRSGSRPATPRNNGQALTALKHDDHGPQWPLTPAPLTPVTPQSAKTSRDAVVSPTSADSRGTKRAAAEHDMDNIEIHQDGEDEDEGATTPKKIRKTASRDFAIPGLRSMTGRRKPSAGRRISSTSNLPPLIVHHNQPQREPNKLTKRPPPCSLSPSKLAGGIPSAPSTPRSSAEVPSPWRAAGGTRRNVSESSSYYSLRAVGSGSMSSRVLRPRGPNGLVEPLSVVPDANRGIPSVPAIPAKFTFGEDRENGEPWRGLRR